MDRVKLEALERADLEDVKALTDLAYEYDQRALGALLGASDLSTYDGGLLSGPEVTYDHGNGQITLSSFTFVEFTAGGAPVDSNGNSLSPEARVIRFDSSKSGHNNHPIDVSSARAVGTTYTLYARSIQVASDASARRRWDVSSQSEVSYSPTTRFRERVDFAVGTSRPTESTTAGDGQWAPLLTYSVDSANTLSYTAISALDVADGRILALLQPSASLDTLSSSLFLQSSSLGTQSRNHGLLDTISVIKHLLYRVINDGSTDSLYTPVSTYKWWNGPPMSLGEAKSRIEQLESRTAGLNNIFPFSVEIQISVIGGAYSENVRISQTNFSPFTNEMTVAFDNRYTTAGVAPSAFNSSSTNATDIIERIGHPVFIFDSSFNGGEVFMFSACHTTHTVRSASNSTTTWGSITGAYGGVAQKNIAYSFLEETDLPNGTTPAPRASLIGSRSYYDDSGVLQTSPYALKIAAYIDPSDLSTDATDNEGLTLTLNYMLLVRR